MSEPPIAISAASLVIVHPRRGRPRVQVPTVPVTTWIPETAAARIYDLAKRQDVSASSLVRSLLLLQLRDKPIFPTE